MKYIKNSAKEICNALMKKSIGKDAAKEWATAHEAESSGIDRQMDLLQSFLSV